MGFVIRSHGATDVGLKREKNEDYFLLLDEAELYILADGMGGHASGQVASRLTTDHIVEFITETCRQDDIQWRYPVHEGASFEEAAISNAIQYANEQTYFKSKSDSRLEGMGTTVCVILGTERHMVIGHVGDSRVYRYRDGALVQLTRDHSLLNHYLDIGALAPEESKEFQSNNVIVRAIGLNEYVDPEIRVVEKRHGDLFLVCSDGLSDLVDDWIVQNTIESALDDLNEIGRKLIRLANQAGGKDNITILLLRVDRIPGDDEVTDPLGVPAVRAPDPRSGRE